MNTKHITRFTGWFMLVSIAISGCDKAPSIESDVTANTASSNKIEHRKINANSVAVPVISGAELETLIRQSSQPVLVEFGVDFLPQNTFWPRNGLPDHRLGREFAKPT